MYCIKVCARDSNRSSSPVVLSDCAGVCSWLSCVGRVGALGLQLWSTCAWGSLGGASVLAASGEGRDMSGAAMSSCVRFLQTWAGAGAYSDRRRSLATELSVMMIVSSTLSTDDLSPRVGRFWRDSWSRVWSTESSYPQKWP